MNVGVIYNVLCRCIQRLITQASSLFITAEKMADSEEKEPFSTIQPLKDFEQLMAWNPSKCNVTCKASIPLQKVTEVCTEKARTLVCHDYAGGYLDDKYVQGVWKSDCYRFYHWQYIDTFVYFSHNFVTIPPPCWTNAAHKHGVKVLGTLITEWDDGKKLCSLFLQNHKMVVDQLVALTQFYQFDGWLINIENEISSDKIHGLLSFLKLLTQKMHEICKHSQVIWYDSITVVGKLAWQNQLNQENELFFNVCDGIFLNYTWKEEYLKQSFYNAGKRHLDVYVGVDVFGRGCFGGGGFNCNKALSLIRKYSLSVAIFAQAWTYEANDKDEFVNNEINFWNHLKQDLHVHRLTHVPLVTSFCQGWGKNYYHCGMMLHNKHWCNMSLQNIQLSTLFTHTPTEKNMQFFTGDSFSGGGCIRLFGSAEDYNYARFQLFKCEIPVCEPLLLSYVFKRVENQLSIQIHLELRIHSEGTDNTCLCIAEDCSTLAIESDITLAGNTNCVQGDWIVASGFKLDPSVNNGKITEINVICTPNSERSTYDLLLGQISLIPARQADEEILVSGLHYEVLNLSESSSKRTILLKWTTPESYVGPCFIFSMENSEKDKLYQIKKYVGQSLNDHLVLDVVDCQSKDSVICVCASKVDGQLGRSKCTLIIPNSFIAY